MRLLRVTDQSSELLLRSMAILRKSFPSNAMLREERMLELLSGEQYQLFAAAQDDEVAGMAIVYFSQRLRFAWLDYMAIRSDLRGAGWGSDLFREIAHEATNRTPAPEWLFLEVDDPYAGDHQHQQTSVRRIEFYRRLGARLLASVPYKFPSPSGPPLPMRLMACRLREARALTPHYLRDVVREIFLSIHGRRRSDELLLWFAASVPEEIQML